MEEGELIFTDFTPLGIDTKEMTTIESYATQVENLLNKAIALINKSNARE